MTTIPELMPCPSCGGTREQMDVVRTFKHSGENGVACINPECKANFSVMVKGSQIDAAIAWNTRA